MIIQKNIHCNSDYKNYISLLKSSVFLSPWCIVNKELIIVEANLKISSFSKFDTVIGLHIIQAFLSHILEEKLEQFIITGIKNNNITVSIHEQQYNIEVLQIQNSPYILLVFMDLQNTSTNNNENKEEIFIQNISHELRTPLTLILGYVEHLIGNQDTFPFKEKLYCIQQQGNRLHNTIEALTYLYFPHYFQQQLPSTYETINDIIIEFLDRQINKENKDRIIFIQCQKNTKIKIQKIFMYIVLNNLIDNAIKFSPKETDIIIKTEEREDTVLLSVQDQGIGIQQHLQQKIFERFYRINNSDYQNIQGSGLGLTITKKIMETMNSKIELHSAINKGTTVFLTFPKNKK